MWGTEDTCFPASTPGLSQLVRMWWNGQGGNSILGASFGRRKAQVLSLGIGLDSELVFICMCVCVTGGLCTSVCLSV